MDIARDSMMDRAVWNFLRYACGREIFCARCGRIHDVSRAVHAERKKPDGSTATMLVCADCWRNELAPRVEPSDRGQFDIIYGPAFTRDGRLRKRLPSPWASEEPRRPTKEIGWPTEIKVAEADGKLVPYTVRVRWRSGGLIVHQELHTLEGQRPLWAITHKESGLRVCLCRNLSAARSGAKRLLAIMSWEGDKDAVIAREKPHHDAVVEVLKDIRAE